MREAGNAGYEPGVVLFHTEDVSEEFRCGIGDHCVLPKSVRRNLGEPLYLFGCGLSYATSKFSNLKAGTTRLTKSGHITVDVNVTDSGPRTGDEVVQPYVKHLKPKVERARGRARGFQRVTLQLNETKTIHIPLQAQQLAYCSEQQAKFIVESNLIKAVSIVGQRSKV
ncbi:MAG: hypothetical protein BGO25_01435 [Acidobacteriales bacterium 59-55]|nr:MAG: hypothetical protein BGO25_01435 [Acidobacteriales bacterium 59-55]